MRATSFWNPEDLGNPGSRVWRREIEAEVKTRWPDLGCHFMAGRGPRPFVQVFDREWASRLGNRAFRGGEGQVWAMCCMKAKFGVVTGSGDPGSTWDIVWRDRKNDTGHVAFGFWIENGLKTIPEHQTLEFGDLPGYNAEFFRRDSDWDWDRFRSLFLESAEGREHVVNMMRSWQPRRLCFRAGSLDDSDEGLNRRYWFDGDALVSQEQRSTEFGEVSAASVDQMFDSVLDRDNQETAWVGVHLMEYAPYRGGEIEGEPETSSRVINLLQMQLNMMRQSWAR